VKKLTAAILVAAFAVPSFAAGQAAQSAAPADKKTQTETAAPAKKEPLTAAAVADKLKELDASLQTLQCSFSQTITFGDSGIASKITGRLSYEKPSKLRIEHITPQKQVVYTDKSTITIYKPEDSQVVKMRWEDWKRQQMAMFSGISDFGSYSSIIEKHRATVTETPKAIKLTLTPKENPKLYTLILTLSPKDYFIEEITLRAGTTKAVTKLENVERNGKIPPELFEFKAPAGAEVLEF